MFCRKEPPLASKRTGKSGVVITLNCPENAGLQPDRERIIRFADRSSGRGGLISFKRQDDGRLTVNPHGLDEGVEVVVGKEREAAE